MAIPFVPRAAEPLLESSSLKSRFITLIKNSSIRLLLKLIISIFVFCIPAKSSFAQCPFNIDFETGTFSGWTGWTGNATNSGPLIYPTGTTLEQHLIMAASGSTDPFGHFPLQPPNGSHYFLKLGNEDNGAFAEGISYDFTIPATANEFSISYYYAIVLQNPSHQPEQQPQMAISVQNLSTGNMESCSSFTFVADGTLPGFYPSGPGSSTLCRSWTRNIINLDGHAGQTYRILFKTMDCTLGGHFGYAYIDVDAECRSYMPGASYCAGDTSVDLEAPANYQSYAWYDAGHNLLGTQQTLHLAPVPPAGTHISVEVTPYNGYGCFTILETELTPNLTVTANAGPDINLCEKNTAILGGTLTPGVTYEWSPAAGLNNAHIPNPVATVNGSGAVYTLTASSHGGGCVSTDVVNIIKEIDNTLTVTGASTSCLNPGDQVILHVNPATPNIQWYKNGVAIPGATQPQYIVTQSGNYRADLWTATCMLSTITKKVNVYYTPYSSFTINNNVQCYSVNDFVFTNANTAAAGIVYQWDFGDGQTSSAANPHHSYAGPGTFTVQFIATSEGGCTAGSSQTVTVKPNAKADFSVNPKCILLPTEFQNTSLAPGAPLINYAWNFGNGQTSGTYSPHYTYTTDGSYTVTLSATSAECPQPDIKQKTVVIDKPAAAQRYPDRTAITNFPLQLSTRTFSGSAKWNPAINLNDPYRKDPVFRGFGAQLYDITLTTKTGCITVDTQMVKMVKEVNIFVPAAFTPNGDGINDYLKPLLYGFKKVNYFKIYDRWGKLLFASEDDLKGWDGKNGNMPLDTQTVIWLISAVDMDGVTHTEKGTTIIMR